MRDLLNAVNVSRQPAFGYFIDGKLVGIASGFIYEQDLNSARIRYLYVDARYRRKAGIGRALLGEFERFMKSKGVKFLRAEMALRKYNSAEFYKKCGFELVGKTVNSLQKTI